MFDFISVIPWFLELPRKLAHLPYMYFSKPNYQIELEFELFSSLNDDKRIFGN